jgi:hypothetical protein
LLSSSELALQIGSTFFHPQMHFVEQRMPSAEKKNKNKVGHESGPTVPNGNAGNASSEVREHGRDDAEDGNDDAEPNAEKPRSDRNGCQVKDEKRVLETGKVVKPPDEGYKKQTSSYN